MFFALCFVRALRFSLMGCVSWVNRARTLRLNSREREKRKKKKKLPTEINKKKFNLKILIFKLKSHRRWGLCGHWTYRTMNPKMNEHDLPKHKTKPKLAHANMNANWIPLTVSILAPSADRNAMAGSVKAFMVSLEML